MRRRIVLGIILTGVTLLSDAALAQPKALVGGPAWIRRQPSNLATVIFVHGVTGNATGTWTNGTTGAYWPALITQDCAFKKANVYVYEYPSRPLKGSFTIDEVAESFKQRLDSDGVLESESLIFLSHSMGGLVTRALLLKYRAIAQKTSFLYFYSTPTEGSPYASLVSLGSQNSQFKNMYPLKSDSYLAVLQSNWLAAQLGLRSYCAYETQDTFHLRIVDLRSASNLCTESLVPINADHVQVVKPDSDKADAYIAFRNAFREWRRSGGGSRTVAGGPQIDHPFVAADKSVETQIQLFAEDEVTFFAAPGTKGRVRLGGNEWHTFREGYTYMVVGEPGHPIVPEFDLRPSREVKVEVKYSRYLNRPRDLSAASAWDDCLPQRPAKKS